jgi:lysylphosphatidylglycerol synthetase-like protein (DUF2156 family)
MAMIGSFALLVGIGEWLLGTRLAAAVTVVGQLVGVLVAAGFLLSVRGTGWRCAVDLSQRLDMGFSAGAMAVLAVASAVLRPPWRLRVRLLLGLYVIVSVVYLGSLADVEHFLVVALGLAAGPRLTRHLGVREPGRPSRREWRLLAVGGLVLIVVGTALSYFLPSDGPLGDTGDAGNSLIDVAIVVVLGALLVNRIRKGHRVAWRWAVGLSALNLVLGLLVLVLAIVIAVLKPVDARLDLSSTFVADRLIWVALLVVLVAGSAAFRVPSRRKRRGTGTGTGTDRDTAVDLLQQHGGSTVSWMATWPENRYFGTDDGRSCQAWQAHAGVAIGLGDAIGPPEDRAAALREFARSSEMSGLVPCVFSASDATAREARETGWLTVQVAEDTLVDLPDLEFRGKAWQDVRSALNKAGKQSITFRLVTLADERWSLVAQVREISEQWVGDKGLPEMGFTLGGKGVPARHLGAGAAAARPFRLIGAPGTGPGG